MQKRFFARVESYSSGRAAVSGETGPLWYRFFRSDVHRLCSSGSTAMSGEARIAANEPVFRVYGKGMRVWAGSREPSFFRFSAGVAAVASDRRCVPSRTCAHRELLSPAFFRGKGRGGPGAGRVFVSFSSDEIFLHFFLTVFPLVHNIRYFEVTI